MSFFLKVIKPDKTNLLVWFQLLLFVLLLLTRQINAVNFVLIYFLESIVIGVFHFVFLLSLKSQAPDSNGSRVFISLFFLTHYMFFIFVQSTFVFGFLEKQIPEIDNGFQVFKNMSIAIHLEGMLLLLGMVILNQFFQYIKRWQNQHFFESYHANEIMFQPYPRVFIQQFTVILSGFFIVFTQSILWVALLLIIMITFFDLFLIALRTDADKRKKMIQLLTQKGTKKADMERLFELFIH